MRYREVISRTAEILTQDSLEAERGYCAALRIGALVAAARYRATADERRRLARALVRLSEKRGEAEA